MPIDPKPLFRPEAVRARLAGFAPSSAVDGFLGVVRGRYEEVHHGYQVWVRKNH